jgi:DNA-binding transcriptional LysR family regulator
MVKISLRQLKIFEALVKTKGYTRAASMLHLTQPAVSMQIKHLEDYVGKPLFERHSKIIVLTDAGKILYQHSCKVLQSYQEMLTSVEAIKEEVPILKIYAATTANHLVSHMLAAFSTQKPELDFSLNITNREVLVQRLHEYEPDLVIMGEPPSQLKNELQAQEIMVNPLVMIASPEHPLAKRSSISLHELAKNKFIVREQGSGTKAAIEIFFKHYGHKFESTLEMSSNEAIKHSVMAGLGLGIASLHTIKLELETKNLIIVNAEHFPIMRHWYIVRRKGKNLTSTAQAFQEFVMQESDNYMKSYRKVFPRC